MIRNKSQGGKLKVELRVEVRTKDERETCTLRDGKAGRVVMRMKTI